MGREQARVRNDGKRLSCSVFLLQSKELKAYQIDVSKMEEPIVSIIPTSLGALKDFLSRVGSHGHRLSAWGP